MFKKPKGVRRVIREKQADSIQNRFAYATGMNR